VGTSTEVKQSANGKCLYKVHTTALHSVITVFWNETRGGSTAASGPALGMFEVFGRTGPPILGGCQFWLPLFSVTAPSRVQTPPVKHTSLHSRFGVLKCSKPHLQQTRISKIFWGTNPRTHATGSALEHNEQGRQLSNLESMRGMHPPLAFVSIADRRLPHPHRLFLDLPLNETSFPL